MSIPPEGLAVPDEVLARSWNRPARAVWRNGLGGVTWHYETADGPEYFKIGPNHHEFDVEGEAARLDWLQAWLPVPRVLAWHRDAEQTWFVTAEIPGESAVSPRNQQRPDIVVPALGRGLRRFHDALPVDQCPFTWAAEDRAVGYPDFDEPVPTVPARDLVVCHGDACNPNFLVSEAGDEVVGYVDLARAGLADRHADLAPAVLSLGWNFGEGLEETFLTAYCGGTLTVDQERLAFYQRLWLAA